MPETRRSPGVGARASSGATTATAASAHDPPQRRHGRLPYHPFDTGGCDDAYSCAHPGCGMPRPHRNHRAPDRTDPKRPQPPEDSWAPVDLGPYLSGQVERPKPTVGLARTDGLQLLYPGKEHAFIGEMESGKSWMALACVAAELAAGNHVVYIHFEESDPSDSVERLQALGVRDTDILERFRFVGPHQPVTPDRMVRLLDPPPTLAILDGVNEGMSMHGQAIREEDGAAAFRRRLIRPFIVVGAATLSLDHVVKDREGRGRYALGSVHKGNAMSGTMIVLENAEPFGRQLRGRSHVFVTKDRPGHLRHNGRTTKTPGKTFLGELVVDDLRRYNPWLELTFFAPKDQGDDTPAAAPAGNQDDDRVLSTIQALLAQGKEANLRAVRASAGLGKDKVDNALARLELAGRIVETKGPNRSRLFGVADGQSSAGAA